jgi:hypothetical protein
MKTIKNTLYIIGVIVLIVKIFFRDDIPKDLDIMTGYLMGVFLLVVIILEVLTRQK